MPVTEELLEIVVCPVTRRALRPATAPALARLNDAIARGAVRNVAGRAVTAPLAEALVREGDDLAYPVTDDIPVLLAEEGIPLGVPEEEVQP